MWHGSRSGAIEENKGSEERIQGANNNANNNITERDLSVSLNVWKVNHAPPKGHMQEVMVIISYNKFCIIFVIAVFCFVFFYGGYKDRHIEKL